MASDPAGLDLGADGCITATGESPTTLVLSTGPRSRLPIRRSGPGLLRVRVANPADGPDGAKVVPLPKGDSALRIDLEGHLTLELPRSGPTKVCGLHELAGQPAASARTSASATARHVAEPSQRVAELDARPARPAVGRRSPTGWSKFVAAQ